MKKIIIMLAATLSITGCAELQSTMDSINNALAPKIIETTPVEICKALEQNVYRAQDTYLGKYIKVSGPVSIGSMGNISIAIPTGSFLNEYVVVFNYPNIKSLNNGQKLSIYGKVTALDRIGTCNIGVDYYKDAK